MTDLKIRKNGKYYQVGYYDRGKWVNVKHLGTPLQLLEELMRTKQADVLEFKGQLDPEKQ